MLPRLAVVALLLAACGDSTGSSSSSGLPIDRRVAALSDAELRTLCGWFADRHSDVDDSSCPDPEEGELTVPLCIAVFSAVLPTCPATVDTVERCANGRFDSPCDDPDECKFADCFEGD
jgi:hypothetical protein